MGLDRKTIRKYLAPAVAAGIEPGGPTVAPAVWAERVREWFPHLADTRLRQSTWPEIERPRDCIAEMLKLGVTHATIHQRLRDEQVLQVSVTSFKRWVPANLSEAVRRDRVTVLGDDAEPGEQTQIDYGQRLCPSGDLDRRLQPAPALRALHAQPRRPGVCHPRR